jgi:CheY-like chemotaxis protein
MNTPPRILVVDDDAQIRLVLHQVLTRAGFSVQVATNGRECIALHNHAPADLIITDIIMPEMEGIESIRTIRKKSTSTKIIAISGGLRGGPLDILSIAKLMGAARTLAKPFKIEEIISAVNEVLAEPAAQAAGAKPRDSVQINAKH